MEFRYIYHQLDRDSTIYQLNFPAAQKDWIDEWRPLVELNAGYNFGKANVSVTTHHEYQKTYQGEEWINKVYEGYLSLNPNPALTVEAGKKSYLWGKGYAWNPAGFVNRQKDPDDPELNLEGITALSFDYIKSFSSGSLQTIAVTPILIPSFEWENEELGDPGDMSYALKLYVLLNDTDIDLMYFGGDRQSDAFGLDFSRNLKENIEVHGEAAVRLDADKKILSPDGSVATRTEDQWSWLLGLRYLNRYDTTFIFEYYHNGAGYNADEIQDLFRFQDRVFEGFQATGLASSIEEATRKTSPYFRQRNFGEDYLYLKVSQKEPFGILYFTPYTAVVYNVGDGSFNLTPGFTYQPWTNFELGFKVAIPVGPGETEFGEKQDDFRTEFLVRYFF